ncbi:MAG: aromatic-ring-hydroxylating dioxygenase subunit beta [Burkholderiales bacterium]
MDGMTDSKTRALALLDRYVTFLDERQFDAWLDLFTEDAWYAMLLHKDFVADNNMLAIGEDKKRLAGRIEVGQNVERDLTTHLLSAVIASEKNGALDAFANFAVIRRNQILCSGRYHLLLAGEGEATKIRRCVAVLRNDVIHGTIYLPV